MCNTNNFLSVPSHPVSLYLPQSQLPLPIAALPPEMHLLLYFLDTCNIHVLCTYSTYKKDMRMFPKLSIVMSLMNFFISQIAPFLD